MLINNIKALNIARINKKQEITNAFNSLFMSLCYKFKSF